MLEVGMTVKTSYSNFEFVIVSIDSGCTCPDYIDEISMENPPARPLHQHIKGWCDSTKSFGYLTCFDDLTIPGKSYCGGKTELGSDSVLVILEGRPHRPENPVKNKIHVQTRLI